MPCFTKLDVRHCQVVNFPFELHDFLEIKRWKVLLPTSNNVSTIIRKRHRILGKGDADPWNYGSLWVGMAQIFP
jgi:hypothetical protein